MSQPVNAFLSGSSQLKQWSRLAQQQLQVEGWLAQILPISLQRGCHLAQYAPPTVVLNANNGAVAAKLRQMTDEIAEQLRFRGCEVTLIRVQVQVSRAAEAPAKDKSIHLSVVGKNTLSHFAEGLKDSPMKRILQRWVK